MALKLTYFNFPGRAWAIRTCFKIAGTEFVDDFMTFPELQAARGAQGFSDTLPLGQLPILTLPSGKIVTQSGAITRFAARQAGLYPADPEGVLLCDEIIETVNECIAKCPQNSDAEVKKKLREEWTAKDLVKYYTFFSKRISENTPSKYSVGSNLTIADLYLYALLKTIRSGGFDFVPGDSDAAFPIFDEFILNLETNSVFAPYKY